MLWDSRLASRGIWRRWNSCRTIFPDYWWMSWTWILVPEARWGPASVRPSWDAGTSSSRCTTVAASRWARGHLGHNFREGGGETIRFFLKEGMVLNHLQSFKSIGRIVRTIASGHPGSEGPKGVHEVFVLFCLSVQIQTHNFIGSFRASGTRKGCVTMSTCYYTIRHMCIP